MPPPRLLVVVNPVASRVDDRSVQRALDALRPYAAAETAMTVRPGHAADLAREAVAAGFDAIAVMAGDGTANEVVNGVGSALPVGVLPAGGTSVLARALGLSRSITKAARQIGAALAAGRTRTISLGTLNGRRFTFAAGIGIDADTVRRIDERGRSSGRRPGDVAYVLQTAREIRGGRWSEPTLTVETPGHEPMRGASVLVANVHPWSYIGPLPLKLAPRATFEGGLDVVVLSGIRLRDAPAFTRDLLVTGGHAKGRDPRVRYLHDVRELHVRGDRPLPAEVDGDDLGDHEDITFGVLPDAARLLA